MNRHHHRRATHNGFTVIELMITLALAAVLLTLAAPAFDDLIANNRMRTEVYALRATLMEARSEALTERVNVSLCPSNDGLACAGDWNEGYIAFVDADGDGAVDAGDRILLSRTNDSPTITLSFSNAADRVLYNSRGNAQTVAANYNGTFTFCDKRGATKAAGLNVARVGTLAAAVDGGDSDEIVNDQDGVNLVCP